FELFFGRERTGRRYQDRRVLRLGGRSERGAKGDRQQAEGQESRRRKSKHLRYPGRRRRGVPCQFRPLGEGPQHGEKIGDRRSEKAAAKPALPPILAYLSVRQNPRWIF